MRENRDGRTFQAIWQGLRASAPQASAIPGFATARSWKYIFHSTTTSCARTSTSWNQSRGAPERPAVTKPLPAPYKPVESGRQTLLEYVLIAPVPCSKPVAIQNRHRDRLHVHLLPDYDDWRYPPLLCQGEQFLVAHHGWSIVNARVFRA